MKKLKYSQKILSDTAAFIKMIEYKCNKINKEHAKNMIKLVNAIAEGENLNLDMLKEKYLNIKKKEEILEEEDDDKTLTLNYSDTDKILDKTIIEGISYYYENKENGNVYNSSLKLVGTFTNNKVLISRS